MKTKLRFRAAVGARISNVDADVVGRYLEKRFPDGGAIKPEAVVEVAKARTSPLHKFFEWNDRKAAEKYRLDQARYLLRVIVEEVDGHDVRSFHAVVIEATDEVAYVPVHKALATESLWSQVVASALREAQGWAARYRSYKELTPIVSAIEAIERKLEYGHTNKRRATGKAKRKAAKKRR